MSKLSIALILLTGCSVSIANAPKDMEVKVEEVQVEQREFEFNTGDVVTFKGLNVVGNVRGFIGEGNKRIWEINYLDKSGIIQAIQVFPEQVEKVEQNNRFNPVPGL